MFVDCHKKKLGLLLELYCVVLICSHLKVTTLRKKFQDNSAVTHKLYKNLCDLAWLHRFYQQVIRPLGSYTWVFTILFMSTTSTTTTTSQPSPQCLYRHSPRSKVKSKQLFVLNNKRSFLRFFRPFLKESQCGLQQRNYKKTRSSVFVFGCCSTLQDRRSM